MTLDDFLKLTQIVFYVTAGIVAVLTFIKAKNGLLNSVNTEYKRRVMDHLAFLSDELYSEFDDKSENFWAKADSVKEVLVRLHERCKPYKDKIISSKTMPPGIPISFLEQKLTRMLGKFKSDPFIPLSIRGQVIFLLEKRSSVMRKVFIEAIDNYKKELAKGKHWDTLDTNWGWVHNKINDRLYKEGCGTSQIEDEVHKIRESIRKYLESFDPMTKKH